MLLDLICLEMFLAGEERDEAIYGFLSLSLARQTSSNLDIRQLFLLRSQS